MLSFKVTYSIQILDCLRKKEKGLTLTELRNHFIFLPTGTIISDLVLQLRRHNLVTTVSGSSSRLCLNCNLEELSLHTLICAVDEKFVLGQPVGFSYWTPGYLSNHPEIDNIQSQMTEQITEITKNTNVGRMLCCEQC